MLPLKILMCANYEKTSQYNKNDRMLFNGKIHLFTKRNEYSKKLQ